MTKRILAWKVRISLTALLLVITGTLPLLMAQTTSNDLRVTFAKADGSYTIGQSSSGAPVLKADVAVQTDGRWLESR
ncbi:MAG: hypothetical protein WBG23_02275, partial [Acidobacteriaceae bacterium]